MYYVGSAPDADKRYQKHLDGEGAQWTKEHKPIALAKVIECKGRGEALIVEDAVTLWLMAKYSKMSVRGGRWMKEGHENIYGYTEAVRIIKSKSLSKEQVKQAMIDIVKWTIPDHSWYWDDIFKKMPKLKKGYNFKNLGKRPEILSHIKTL